MKLGSLFDGSGGFPLAGSLCGIEPVWAAEVEPYPIAVTRSRFPHMKHLGDVTKVNGADIEPVDIITFGSPCQDMSVAGKRAGLKHEANGDDETTRSGLFLEAIRIIKEMRGATNGVYPRFAVWENVVGAFSSNKGWDFHTVLTEFIGIKEPDAVMPSVPAGGWSYADVFSGSGWSVAYRTFDAQYWGVPQRRRRIYLVLDLRGQRAAEILFEREGLRGYFAESGTPWKGAARDAADRAGATDCEGAIPINTMIATRHKQLGRGTGFGVGEAGDPQFTISAGHEHAVAYTMKIRDENILDDQGGQQITVRTDGKAPTLRTEMHGNIPAVMEPVTIEPGISAREVGHIYEGVCGTLRENAGDNQMAVAYAAGFKASNGAKARSIGWEDEKCPTMVAESVPSVCVKCYDARGNGDGDIVSTLTGDHENRITDYTSVVLEIIPIHDKTTRCKGGGPTRNGDGAGNGLGVGKPGDPCPTLSTCDHHMVCYCMAHGQANAEILVDKSPCLNCNHEQPIVAGVNFRNGTEYPEMSGTLQAKPNGGFSLNCNQVVRVQYIVRRLTPTECARLQGFPDEWGHPDHKDDFTDEEYRFWLDVRNTHAAINGKPKKDYTKAQMLTWYNKLHTDSSEYKMWGNGIALPCALYVMQGIMDSAHGTTK